MDHTRTALFGALAFSVLAAPLCASAQAAEIGAQRSIRLRALVAAGHPTKRNQAP